jgi:hypothetical protein
MTRISKPYLPIALMACFAAACSPKTTQEAKTCSPDSESLIASIEAGGIATINGLAISTGYCSIYVTQWRAQDTERKAEIIRYVFTGGSWEPAGPIYPDARYQDYQPTFSAGEEELLFTSTRPIADGQAPSRQNIWISERQSGDKWGEPYLVQGLEGQGWDGHARLLDDGSIFFASDRAGGAGMVDLYQATRENGGWRIENMDVLNSGVSESDFYIPPDGSYIIFTRYDPQTDDLDLYMSEYAEAQWSPPKPITVVNTRDWQLSPVVTPDGKYLIYMDGRDGGLRTAAMSEIRAD